MSDDGMPELEEIIDASGELRRLGSLVPEQKNLLGAPAFASKFPTWERADILKAVKDPNRVPGRVTFGKKWIVNQGQFGSCCPTAAGGVFAETRYRRGLRDGQLFSGAMLYSTVNGGNSDNGATLSEVMLSLISGGICKFETVPFDKIYKRQIPASAYEEAKKFRAVQEATFHVATIAELQTALAMGFSCVVAVQASRNFSKLNSQGIAGVDNGRGNHAIRATSLELVGGKLVYDTANSWGLSYGIDGRAYLTDDSFEQTIQVHDFFAVADVYSDGN